MLHQKEIVAIAEAYINIVTKEEGAIFPDFKEFSNGILFNYQGKEFVINGDTRDRWFGGYAGFIIGKEKGLIYHDIYRPTEMNDKKLKKRFLANRIPAVSLSGIKAKFNRKT